MGTDIKPEESPIIITISIGKNVNCRKPYTRYGYFEKYDNKCEISFDFLTDTRYKELYKELKLDNMTKPTDEEFFQALKTILKRFMNLKDCVYGIQLNITGILRDRDEYLKEITNGQKSNRPYKGK